MIHKYVLLGSLLVLAACGGKPGAVEHTVDAITQEEVDAKNKICYDQIEADGRAGNPHKLSRWAECKRKYIMPIDKKLYGSQSAKIQQMYDEVVSGMRAAEAGKMPVQAVYDRWDQRQQEIGMTLCEAKYVAANGEQRCLH